MSMCVYISGEIHTTLNFFSDWHCFMHYIRGYLLIKISKLLGFISLKNNIQINQQQKATQL